MILLALAGAVPEYCDTAAAAMISRHGERVAQGGVDLLSNNTIQFIDDILKTYPKALGIPSTGSRSSLSTPGAERPALVTVTIERHMALNQYPLTGRHTGVAPGVYHFSVSCHLEGPVRHEGLNHNS